MIANTSWSLLKRLFFSLLDGDSLGAIHVVKEERSGSYFPFQDRVVGCCFPRKPPEHFSRVISGIALLRIRTVSTIRTIYRIKGYFDLRRCFKRLSLCAALVVEGGDTISQRRHLAVIKKVPRDTPRLRDSPPCVESRLPYTTIETISIVLSLDCVTRSVNKRRSLTAGAPCETLPLQNVSPELSQIVFLEVAPLAEESFIGQGFLVALILQSGEFDATNEVCNLEHPIFSWMCLPVHHRALKEGVLECCVKNAGNEGLPVVVVNLDKVKLGELVEVVKQELGQVALHGTNELIRRLVSALPVCEDVVAERSMLRERAEGHEQLNAQRCIEIPVPFVCPEEGIEVKGNVWETSARERLLVQTDRVGKIVALVMKDQGEQVVLGFSSEVAGLIYKDGELLHETSPLDTKSAGGNPPAKRQPSLRGKPSLLYHKPKR